MEFFLQLFKSPASYMSDSAFLGSILTLTPEKTPGLACMADGSQMLTGLCGQAQYPSGWSALLHCSPFSGFAVLSSRISTIEVKDSLPTAVLHSFNPQRP